VVAGLGGGGRRAPPSPMRAGFGGRDSRGGGDDMLPLPPDRRGYPPHPRSPFRDEGGYWGEGEGGYWGGRPPPHFRGGEGWGGGGPPPRRGGWGGWERIPGHGGGMGGRGGWGRSRGGPYYPPHGGGGGGGGFGWDGGADGMDGGGYGPRHGGPEEPFAGRGGARARDDRPSILEMSYDDYLLKFAAFKEAEGKAGGASVLAKGPAGLREYEAQLKGGVCTAGRGVCVCGGVGGHLPVCVGCVMCDTSHTRICSVYAQCERITCVE
jgi:hypothetical protein